MPVPNWMGMVLVQIPHGLTGQLPEFTELYHPMPMGRCLQIHMEKVDGALCPQLVQLNGGDVTKSGQNNRSDGGPAE